MSKPIAMQEAIITRSITILNRKAGIVYFVGIAARFVTSADIIAMMAMIQKKSKLPDKITANNVRGVSAQP